MFAVLAAILFGLALLLDLIDESLGTVLQPATLVTAGLLCLALHMGGIRGAWRSRRWRRR